MKKYTVLYMLVVILLFSGCSFPVRKSLADSTSADIKTNTQEDGKSVKNNEQVVKDNQSQTGNGAKNSTDSSNKTTNTDKLSVIIYYQDPEGFLIPVTRRVGKQEGIAKATVYALVDSTVNREELEYFQIYPVLPAGTEVLGLNIKDGTAVIDFNGKFLNYSDKNAEKSIVAAVVYTLTEFKTIDRVKILVNGNVQKKLKFGTDITEGLSRKNTMINADSINPEQGRDKADIYVFRHLSDKNIYLAPVSEQYDNGAEELPGKILDSLGKDWGNNKLFSEFPPSGKTTWKQYQQRCTYPGFKR